MVEKGPRGLYLYYFLWQLGAYACARQLVSRLRFDYVHHLTLGGFRVPSFLGFLGLPFIIGPIGGGERAPVRLRKSFPWRAKITDCLRDIANAAALLDPLVRACYKRSRLILCKTRESSQLVPRAFADRVRVQLEIGVAFVERSSPRRPLGNSVRVLYVGRLIYWKGVHLALRAFARFVQDHPQATLTIVGEGAEREWLQRLANELSLNGAVRWIRRIPHNELSTQYETHDLFLFPSLHDSSGNVVLEALSHGLPVVCLDLGGPAEIVNNNCGRVIPTGNCGESDVINALASALSEMADTPGLFPELTEGALRRAQECSWESAVSKTYSAIQG